MLARYDLYQTFVLRHNSFRNDIEGGSVLLYSLELVRHSIGDIVPENFSQTVIVDLQCVELERGDVCASHVGEIATESVRTILLHL